MEAMKKVVITSMLLILIFFSTFINSSQETASNSAPFNSTDQPVISKIDTNANFEAITESGQTVIYKWQTEPLFPSFNFAHVLRGKFIPFKFFNHVFFLEDMAGFICVVQHQSNYLL